LNGELRQSVVEAIDEDVRSLKAWVLGGVAIAAVGATATVAILRLWGLTWAALAGGLTLLDVMALQPMWMAWRGRRADLRRLRDEP
jgi:hypothetical protein